MRRDVIRRGLFSVGGILFAAALTFFYIFPRVQWYKVRDGFTGSQLLVACAARTPIFASIGVDWGHEPPFFLMPKVDAWLACKSVEGHAEFLVTSTDGYRGIPDKAGLNDTFAWLVLTHLECNDPGYSAEQRATCKDAHYAGIRWLLDRGVDLNPEGTCGYLHETIDGRLDEDMFSFLLSIGADPAMRCPPEPSTARMANETINISPTTVAEEIQQQLDWLDSAEFPEVDATLRRMLQKVNAQESRN